MKKQSGYSTAAPPPTKRPSIIDRLTVVHNDDSHHYTYDGHRILGVTEILQLAGICTYDNIAPEVLANVAAKGKEVHLACEDLDRGRGGRWWDDDAELAPRVAAYEKFKADWDFDPELIEQPLYHPEFRYAGQIDRTGTISGEPWARDKVRGRIRITLDLKRVWALRPSTDVQLAGYNLLLQDNEHRRPFALRLESDGTYELREVIHYRDAVVDFLAALRVATWRKKHGAA